MTTNCLYMHSDSYHDFECFISDLQYILVGLDVMIDVSIVGCLMSQLVPFSMNSQQTPTGLDFRAS